MIPLFVALTQGIAKPFRTIFTNLKEPPLSTLKSVHFFINSLVFLVYIVSVDDIKIDQIKVNPIQNWCMPKMINKARGFRGFTFF